MAFNYATKKEQDKKRDEMVKTAQRWFAKGYTAEVIAQGIWNKYGYQTDAKDGVVRIWGRYNSEPVSATRIVREVSGA